MQNLAQHDVEPKGKDLATKHNEGNDSQIGKMDPGPGQQTDKNNNAKFYYCQFFNNCQHFVIN